MRLYIKLVAMIVLAVAMQRYVLNDWRHNEAWFAIRCEIAFLTNDQGLREELVEEGGYLLHRRLDEQVRNAAGGSE